jgi:Flp pilus assembly protein TadD
MTTTQNTKSPTSAAPRSGFQPIPTRIRDLRDAQAVPPLVVQPADEAKKQELVASLGELDSKLAEIHRTSAEAYMTQGIYEKALPHLEAAVAMAPTEIEHWHQLGVVRYLTGNDAGATQAFQAVLSAEPGNDEAWFNMGMVLFGQSQFADAETCFGRSLAIRATDAQTWNNRGVCLWKMGRNQDAKACFLKALQIDANDVDAKFNLQTLG